MPKYLHILGVILFLGNITISAFWRVFAERSKDAAVIKHALNLVIFTDWLFTLPGAILIILTGHMLAARFGGIAAFGWIYHSYAFLSVAALIWLAGLLPIQYKQQKLLAADATAFGSARFKKLTLWWNILGGLAILFPLIALYFMVLRPA